MTRPKTLLIAGYFDWFSGYQETVLARALSEVVDLEIIASDRVAPIFSNDHLERIGVNRRYQVGTSTDQGVPVHRVETHEIRRMVWGHDAVTRIRRVNYDLIIQVMPGQGLPIAATVAGTRARRVVLYGDNSAMWSALSPLKQRVKAIVFAQTKGKIYKFANKRANVVYGYTPETINRLAKYSSQPMHLLPLAFDERRFGYSPEMRNEARRRRSYAISNRVVISAGKFDPRKKLDVLIDAFAKAYMGDPELRLLLVGGDDGPYAVRLKQRIDALKIADVVRVEGFLDHEGLNAAFNAADVGVWPRQPAITIQQAMGTGLPVVLPKNQWVEHLVTRTTGEFVSREATPAELADGINRTLRFDTTSREARSTENARFGGTALVNSILTDVGLAPGPPQTPS